MFIKFEGKMNVAQVIPNISNIVSAVLNKVELPEDTGIQIENLNLSVIMNTPNGAFYATVPRVVDGEETSEILTVVAKLDEEGNIQWEQDNEEESLVDDKTLHEAAGKEYHYGQVESPYADNDLEEVHVISVGEGEENVSSKVFRIIETGKGLVRYYKGGKLIAETEMLPEFLEEFEKLEN